MAAVVQAYAASGDVVVESLRSSTQDPRTAPPQLPVASAIAGPPNVAVGSATAARVGIWLFSSLHMDIPELYYWKWGCADYQAPVICRFANQGPVSAQVSILISHIFDTLFST